jgi:hypothetical protein
MAQLRRNLERTVARLPEIRTHIRTLAAEIATVARTRAAAHNDTGTYAASFRVVRGRVDAHIESSDPHAESKEFGHIDKRTGRNVPGIHAWGGAASDVAARQR